jgi:hypothetical protein
VLAAWSASPSRFREDANAEEDLVLGGYRDRVLVELAQNASDAAVRAGVPGRLRFTLAGAVLRVANTGAPIDAAGVESASTLRASAKRGPDGRDGSDGLGVSGRTVGRFGVGFAATLAVSDEPSIVSRVGAVGWSRARTVAAVAALPELAAELSHRGAAVPVLRLPFADVETAPPAEGFDTEVVLPLRDAAAVSLVTELLAGVDAAMLLTLPVLLAVEVVTDGGSRMLVATPAPDGVVIDGVRWRLHSCSSVVDPSLLQDRPVEERAQRVFDSTWAVPIDDEGRPVALPASVPAVVHAPTPTDEPLTLPALLIAALPLDPTRRHLAAGALRDHLLDEIASAYVELVRALPTTDAVLELVPVGVAAGAADGELRSRILSRLRAAAILPARDGGARLTAPDAVSLDVGSAASDDLDAVLGQVLPRLVPLDWVRSRARALAALGVPVLAIGDLLDDLAGVDRAPSWWHSLYAALASAGVGVDSLAGLPVPLTTGQLARSASGLLMPVGPPGLEILGFRTVDPDAAHPLLLRLGAVEAAPRVLLADERVRAAVANSLDAEEPAAIATVILSLVEGASLQPGEEPLLSALALLGEDGEWYAAEELLLPGSVLAGLVVDDAPFGVIAASYAEQWGAGVLTAVGVLDSFGLVRDTDVLAADHDLDGEDDYLESVLRDTDEPATVAEFVGVRDLELIRDDAWPAALSELAGPRLRATVVEPAMVVTAATRRRVPSYTAWWLRTHRVVNGRLASSDPLLEGLYDVVGIAADDDFLFAVGALSDLDDADPDDLLERLADPRRSVGRSQVKAIYSRVEPAGPVEAVRGLRGGALVCAPVSEAVVIDRPDLAPLLSERVIVPVSLADALRVADLLDLDLASELGGFEVTSEGTAVGDHVVHDELLVTGLDGAAVRLPWRLVGGVLHVDAGSEAFGLGRGRAFRAGEWRRRALLTELARDPAGEESLLLEADLD